MTGLRGAIRALLSTRSLRRGRSHARRLARRVDTFIERTRGENRPAGWIDGPHGPDQRGFLEGRVGSRAAFDRSPPTRLGSGSARAARVTAPRRACYAPRAMAFGRGKVILLGEHGVVYGHPALAAGLGVGVHATAAPSDRDEILARPWGVHASVGSAEPLALGLGAILEGLPPNRPHVRVEVDVGLPGGAGLGCSAAIGVAVTGAIDALLGIDRTDEERGAYSLRWERVFHGNPSGVDNAVAAVGGVALFRRGQPLQPIRAKTPLPLVIAHSGESSSTKEIVAQVARQRDTDPARVDATFEGIAALVGNAKLAVERGDL